MGPVVVQVKDQRLAFDRASSERENLAVRFAKAPTVEPKPVRERVNERRTGCEAIDVMVGHSLSKLLLRSWSGLCLMRAGAGESRSKPLVRTHVIFMFGAFREQQTTTLINQNISRPSQQTAAFFYYVRKQIALVTL